MNIRRKRLSTIPNTSIKALLFKQGVSPQGRQYRQVLSANGDFQLGVEKQWNKQLGRLCFKGVGTRDITSSQVIENRITSQPE
jgi:hypothetical protein